MAILRNENHDRYTVVDNGIVRDDRLSLRDFGLLVKLLSLPDNWGFSENGLSKIISDGTTSIRHGLKNLEDLGYLIRTRQRDESGRLLGVEWIVVEIPTSSPKVENPHLDNPSLDFDTQYNTNISNTKKPKDIVDRNQIPPSLDQVREFCNKRRNGIDPEHFISYYTARGWLLSKGVKMRDWHHAIYTWEKNNKSANQQPNQEVVRPWG